MKDWKENKQENPYSIPEGYFTNMQSSVQAKIKNGAIADKSVDMMDTRAYSSPSSSYFESMQQNVLSRLGESEKTTADLIPNSPYKKPDGYTPKFKSKTNTYPLYKNSRFNALVMAATFLLLVVIGGSYIQTNQSIQVEPNSLAYMNDIGEEEWANFLENEESIRLDGEGADPEVNLNGVSDEELMDYLQEEQYLELF